jgi:hypothetical protein
VDEDVVGDVDVLRVDVDVDETWRRLKALVLLVD